jgi:hypothetical protein
MVLAFLFGTFLSSATRYQNLSKFRKLPAKRCVVPYIFYRTPDSLVVCLKVRDLFYRTVDSFIIHPTVRCVFYKTLEGFVVHLKV